MNLLKSLGNLHEKVVSNLPGGKSFYNLESKVSGSPAAMAEALQLNQWTNPFSPDASSWDVLAGGTQLSKSPKARAVGRLVGSIAGGMAAGSALGGGAATPTAETSTLGGGISSTGGATTLSASSGTPGLVASTGATGTSLAPGFFASEGAIPLAGYGAGYAGGLNMSGAAPRVGMSPTGGITSMNATPPAASSLSPGSFASEGTVAGTTSGAAPAAISPDIAAPTQQTNPLLEGPSSPSTPPADQSGGMWDTTKEYAGKTWDWVKKNPELTLMGVSALTPGADVPDYAIDAGPSAGVDMTPAPEPRLAGNPSPVSISGMNIPAPSAPAAFGTPTAPMAPYGSRQQAINYRPMTYRTKGGRTVMPGY